MDANRPPELQKLNRGHCLLTRFSGCTTTGAGWLIGVSMCLVAPPWPFAGGGGAADEPRRIRLRVSAEGTVESTRGLSYSTSIDCLGRCVRGDVSLVCCPMVWPMVCPPCGVYLLAVAPVDTCRTGGAPCEEPSDILRGTGTTFCLTGSGLVFADGVVKWPPTFDGAYQFIVDFLDLGDAIFIIVGISLF